jgi:polyhydroxyalkanoic acid synthase PhaR subunit
MPEDTSNNGPHKAKDENRIPDLAELWKEMYFKAESSWSDAFREYLGTKHFVSLLNSTLENYLSGEKVVRENLDKYMEVNPLASKKDIARVAELVISLEDKLDNLEDQFLHNMNNLASGLLKMVAYQEKVKEELAAIREEVQALTKTEVKAETGTVEINESKTRVENRSRRTRKNTPNDQQTV